jgi:hypothetical protein
MMKILWLSIKKFSKEKLNFPETLTSNLKPLYKFRNAKSLVKHLLVADLTKRYGNLKGGVNDIKTHRWFAEIDWEQLAAKKIPAIYKPIVK